VSTPLRRIPIKGRGTKTFEPHLVDYQTETKGTQRVFKERTKVNDTSTGVSALFQQPSVKVYSNNCTMGETCRNNRGSRGEMIKPFISNRQKSSPIFGDGPSWHPTLKQKPPDKYKHRCGKTQVSVQKYNYSLLRIWLHPTDEFS